MTTLTKSISDINKQYYYTYKCEVTENSFDVLNNTSNVTITFYIKGPYSPAFYDWNTWYGITVDGQVKHSGRSSPRVDTNYLQLLSWTGDVAHNDDGTKDIDVGVYLYHNSPSGYLPTQYKSNTPLSMGSVVLTDIPRSGVITSASDIVLENACNISWNHSSNDFKYKIRFSLELWDYTTDFICPQEEGIFIYDGYVVSGTIICNGTTIYDQLPTSVSGAMTATLTTYDLNNEQVGSSSSKTFTVTIPSDVKPMIGAVELIPEAINDNAILVKNKNSLTINVSDCIAGDGSSIKAYTFSGPSISKTVPEHSPNVSVVVPPVSNYGTLSYTVTITDSRGRTASQVCEIECYDYYAPSFAGFDAYRTDADGTANVNGVYLTCIYEPRYASVNSTNDIVVTVHYNDNEIVASNGLAIIDLGGDTSTTYKVRLTIEDEYSGTSTSQTITVFGQARIINITQDGTGVAIGKMAESSESFACRWDATFDGDVTFKGNVYGIPNTQTIVEVLNNTDNTLTNYSFVPSEYSLLIFGINNSDDSGAIFTTLPSMLAAVNVEFQAVGNNSFSKWQLSNMGITRVSDTGYIKYIYGLKV